MDSPTGLADISWMAKRDLRGAALPSFEWPARNWNLRRGHTVVTVDPASMAIFDRIPSDDSVSVTDVTSVYAQFLLAGPQARTILSALTSLNLQPAVLANLRCAQARVAGVVCAILRDDRNEVPAFQLLVTRDYAEFFSETLLEAGRPYGLAPMSRQETAELGGLC